MVLGPMGHPQASKLPRSPEVALPTTASAAPDQERRRRGGAPCPPRVITRKSEGAVRAAAGADSHLRLTESAAAWPGRPVACETPARRERGDAASERGPENMSGTVLHRIYQAISALFPTQWINWFSERLNCGTIGGTVTGYRRFPVELAGSGTAEFDHVVQLALSSRHGKASRASPTRLAGPASCPLPTWVFHAVFSNSVDRACEHSQCRSTQLRCWAATLCCSLGAQCWPTSSSIQPHLMTPFIHWLPVRWQRRLLRNFTPWGWLTRPPTPAVDAFIAEVRLLTRSEMRKLFPECELLAGYPPDD